MGDRAVDCARLESVCAERHRGFESPPIRHLTVASALPGLQMKLHKNANVTASKMAATP